MSFGNIQNFQNGLEFQKMFMFHRIYANSFLFFIIGLKKIKICFKSDAALCSYISALAIGP